MFNNYAEICYYQFTIAPTVTSLRNRHTLLSQELFLDGTNYPSIVILGFPKFSYVLKFHILAI